MFKTSASRSTPKDPSLHAKLMSKIQTIKKAASRDSHLMSLPGIERLIHCSIYLRKAATTPDEFGDAHELWELIEMGIVSVVSRLRTKPPRVQFEEMNALYGIILTLDRLDGYGDRFDDVKGEMLGDISESLKRELVRVSDEEFPALAGALVRCWPLVASSEQVKLDELLSVVGRRCGVLLLSENQHNTSGGTSSMLNNGTSKGAAAPAHKSGESQTIMQLRQEIEALKIEKQHQLKRHAKDTADYREDINLLNTALLESAETRQTLGSSLKERDAEVKDLTKALAKYRAGR